MTTWEQLSIPNQNALSTLVRIGGTNDPGIIAFDRTWEELDTLGLVHWYPVDSIVLPTDLGRNIVPKVAIMTTPNHQPTAAQIAGELSAEEWAALEYVQTNGSYPINDEDKSLTNFDRVFLKGLLNKIYNQDSPRYFLNVYGRTVLEASASAPVAGKPIIETFLNGDIVALLTDITYQDGTLLPEGAEGYVVESDTTMTRVLFPLYDNRWILNDNLRYISHRFERYSGGQPQPAPTQPVSATAEGEETDDDQTFAELCEREIVKIRSLTLKDDEYTSSLLGEAVGSPVGITMCVEARMKQIADLQEENKRLKKQVKKLSRKSNLDDGFIDYLTQESDE